MRVAGLQFDIAWEDVQENIRRVDNEITRLMEDSGGGDVDLVVLPEMWSTGFTMEAPDADDTRRALDAMRGWAEQLDAAITGSLSMQEANDTGAGVACYNRMYFVTPSGIEATYTKRHLFRFAGEDDHYEPGSSAGIVAWRGWRIALQICYDLRFPESARNVCGSGGYDALIYVANWPGVRSFAWQALLVARALENQAYVIGINRVGPDANDLDHDGRSLCIDPYGSVQSQLTPGETGWVRTNWDAAELARFRKKFPVLKDRR